MGLELDSGEMVVRIPRDKVIEIIGKIKDMLSHEKTTLREMQSLIGSLNFACRAIAPGRPFLSSFNKFNLWINETSPSSESQ